jgi:hypothetical protein
MDFSTNLFTLYETLHKYYFSQKTRISDPFKYKAKICYNNKPYINMIFPLFSLLYMKPFINSTFPKTHISDQFKYQAKYVIICFHEGYEKRKQVYTLKLF